MKGDKFRFVNLGRLECAGVRFVNLAKVQGMASSNPPCRTTAERVKVRR
jgi:hypothetical protein